MIEGEWPGLRGFNLLHQEVRERIEAKMKGKTEWPISKRQRNGEQPC